jgi:putative transposase
VEERRDVFGVEPICRAVGVPVSTYYARRSRKPSRRALADRELIAEIYAAREGYRSVYGVRKTWKELKRRDVDVGRDRVARLMRQEGLEGVRPREEAADDDRRRDGARAGARPAATRLHGDASEREVGRRHHLSPRLERLRLPGVHPRLLQPDDRWLAARNAHAHRSRARRARDGERASPTNSGVDRAHRSRLPVHEHPLHRPARRLGAAPSVGSRGDAYDNAMAEAWVATFKSELVDGRRFPSYEHAEHETLNWIGFYNEERLHEELGDLPPAEYEELNIKKDNSPYLSTK